ncbi:MAG: hypothetical protein AAF211_18650, partial [Myxococcota bacterium]
SFSRDLAQGQLEMLQGSESPWPDDVRTSLTPERFEEALRERLEDFDGVDVDRVDCDEYPCVAVLRLAEDAALEGWNEPAADGLREWITGELGEGGSMSVNTSAFRHPGFEAKYILFAGIEGGRDREVGVRTKYRMDTMVETLGQDAAAEAERRSPE